MKGNLDGVATVGPLGFDTQTGLFYKPVTVNGSGTLSHLGKVTITGTHRTEFIFTGNQITSSLVLDGQLTITAANGDQLYVQYTGSGVRTQNGFNDTFHYTITGGTGRFGGSSGS